MFSLQDNEFCPLFGQLPNLGSQMEHVSLDVLSVMLLNDTYLHNWCIEGAKLRISVDNTK